VYEKVLEQPKMRLNQLFCALNPSDVCKFDKWKALVFYGITNNMAKLLALAAATN
jgi:hypothetical protein